MAFTRTTGLDETAHEPEEWHQTAEVAEKQAQMMIVVVEPIGAQSRLLQARHCASDAILDYLFHFMVGCKGVTSHTFRSMLKPRPTSSFSVCIAVIRSYSFSCSVSISYGIKQGWCFLSSSRLAPQIHPSSIRFLAHSSCAFLAISSVSWVRSSESSTVLVSTGLGR